MSLPNQMMVIATVVIALATAANLMVSYKMWAEMKSSGTDTHDLAKAADAQSHQAILQTDRMTESLSKTDKLITATIQLATEARRSADIAKRTMVTGTRAYLALGDVRIYCPPCDTGNIPPPTRPTPYSNDAAINLFFINSGRSPAHDIAQNAVVYIAPFPKHFEFPEEPDVLEQPKHLIVQPSPQFPLEISRGTRAEAIYFARHHIPMYPALPTPEANPLAVYGHVTYTDVFDQRHTLLYCVQFQASSDVGPEHWNACPYHNEEYDGDYKPGR